MAKKLYGTDPDQVPTNADLGTIAYQDKDNASISKIQVENDGDLQLNPDGGKITIGANNFDATSGDLQGIANLYGRGVGSTKTFAKQTFQNSNDSGSSYAQIQGRRIDSNYGTELWFYVNPQGVAQSPTHVMTLQNGGDLAVIDGNVVMANGHGIDFSATGDGSGTMTSELLDDYEEGNWSPALSYGGTSATLTSSTGQYVKIGRLVHVWLMIQVANLNSGSGSIELSGLPYSSSGNMVYYHGNIQGNAEMNLPTGAGSVMPYVTGGTSTARFLYMTNSTHNDVTSTHFPAPITVYGQMTYSTAT